MVGAVSADESCGIHADGVAGHGARLTVGEEYPALTFLEAEGLLLVFELQAIGVLGLGRSAPAAVAAATDLHGGLREVGVYTGTVEADGGVEVGRLAAHVLSSVDVDIHLGHSCGLCPVEVELVFRAVGHHRVDIDGGSALALLKLAREHLQLRHAEVVAGGVAAAEHHDAEEGGGVLELHDGHPVGGTGAHVQVAIHGALHLGPCAAAVVAHEQGEHTGRAVAAVVAVRDFIAEVMHGLGQCHVDVREIVQRQLLVGAIAPCGMEEGGIVAINGHGQALAILIVGGRIGAEHVGRQGNLRQLPFFTTFLGRAHERVLEDPDTGKGDCHALLGAHLHAADLAVEELLIVEIDLGTGIGALEGGRQPMGEGSHLRSAVDLVVGGDVTQHVGEQLVVEFVVELKRGDGGAVQQHLVVVGVPRGDR